MLKIYPLKLFTGNAHPELAKEIARYLGVPLGKVTVTHFADGETYVRFDETVRGCDVFLIQPTCRSVNHNIIELALMIDALKRSSAQRITAVIPYYGYSRQDRQALPREPISAKLIANLLTAAGVSRLLTIDLHSGQAQGFFDIPVDHLYGLPLLQEYFQNKNLKDFVVVSPDAGGVKKANRLAEEMQLPLVILDKRRPKHNQAAIATIIGNVKNKNAIIIDDIIDTAGTICRAADELKKAGAKEIYVASTHAIFSSPAINRLSKAPIKEIVVTNTIPIHVNSKLKNLKIISVASLLGEAIRNIHKEHPLSGLSVAKMNLKNHL